MSSVSSINSGVISALYSSSSKNSKSGNASSMAEKLFSKLDTTSKGYLEKSDLTTAFSQLSSSNSTSSASASADDVFAKLDADQDGKVTEGELASGLEKLASTLDSQFNQMRMSGAMPPPPPSGSDSGFTKDELTQQLSDIGSSDSTRSSLISKIVSNFASADTDSDGKVSDAEAMAYDKATSSSSTSSSLSATSAASATDSGFTLAQLTDQVSENGSTDSKRASLISKLVTNFAAADTDADGKVSGTEAMAYDKLTSSATASTVDSASSSDQAVLKRIMELMDSYASNNSTQSNRIFVSA